MISQDERPGEGCVVSQGPSDASSNGSSNNEVRLRGVPVAPAGPSPSADSDIVWSVQVAPATGSGKGDRFDCRAGAIGVTERSLDWPRGALVEVHGSLRRRFFRVGTTTVSKVEVLVADALLVELPETLESPSPAGRTPEGAGLARGEATNPTCGA